MLPRTYRLGGFVDEVALIHILDAEPSGSVGAVKPNRNPVHDKRRSS